MIRAFRMVRVRLIHRVVIAAVIVLIAKPALCQEAVGSSATDSRVGSDPEAVAPGNTCSKTSLGTKETFCGSLGRLASTGCRSWPLPPQPLDSSCLTPQI